MKAIIILLLLSCGMAANAQSQQVDKAKEKNTGGFQGLRHSRHGQPGRGETEFRGECHAKLGK